MGIDADRDDACSAWIEYHVKARRALDVLQADRLRGFVNGRSESAWCAERSALAVALGSESNFVERFGFTPWAANSLGPAPRTKVQQQNWNVALRSLCRYTHVLRTIWGGHPSHPVERGVALFTLRQMHWALLTMPHSLNKDAARRVPEGVPLGWNLRPLLEPPGSYMSRCLGEPPIVSPLGLWKWSDAAAAVITAAQRFGSEKAEALAVNSASDPECPAAACEVPVWRAVRDYKSFMEYSTPLLRDLPAARLRPDRQRATAPMSGRSLGLAPLGDLN